MTDNISRYDNLIKKYAKENGLDWRFVSAIIFQESKFNPTAVGAGGAYGLMQIMPITATHLGIALEVPPEQQIENGCKLIAQIVEKYRKCYKKENDLLKIVLVAYNTGNGNVDSARDLAEKEGLNPNCWEDMEFVLNNVSNKSFTQEKTGIKGKIALEYVYKVLRHYAHYKNMYEEEK
jgi:membrane-bound lytic murein transglycosylase F